MAKSPTVDTSAAEAALPGRLATTPTRRVFQVENNTSRVIVLPITPSFPSGLVLLPGQRTDAPEVGVLTEDEDGNVTTVPTKYFEELFSIKVKNAEGKEWHPGRRCIAELERPVTYTTSRGERHGPQITIYEKEQLTGAGGPAPESLDVYWKPYRDDQDNEQNVAMQMLSCITDRAALQRYAKFSKHAPIKAAAQSRLNGQS